MPQRHCLTRRQDMLLSALALEPGAHSLVWLCAALATVSEHVKPNLLKKDAERLVTRGLAKRVGERYERAM